MKDELTSQEIFDTVAAHLIKQGHKSKRSDNFCLYRGPDGDKCAIGILITDDEYSQEMESNAVQSLESSGFLPKRLKPHLNLLYDLQVSHDEHFFNVDELRLRLRVVANRHKLSFEEN